MLLGKKLNELHKEIELQFSVVVMYFIITTT